MKAKDFLRSHRKYDEMIENKLYEAKRWEEIALNISPRYGGEKVQSSGSKQKMEDAVARFIDIDNEINDRIDELIDLEQNIVSVLEQLPPSEYSLLHKIYIQHKTIEEAAYELDKRSESWGKMVHRRALIMVQKILDEREREKEKE